MKLPDALGDAFKKISNMKAPFQPLARVASNKPNDLLAFRTITMMLQSLQSPNTRISIEEPISIGKMDRRELRVLDALSTVLIRQHEITAVVAGPYDGSTLQVFVSVVYASDSQPSHQSGSSDEGQLSWLKGFTFSMNPRRHKINGHNDSLINKTGLPLVAPNQDNPLPVVADGEESLLNAFLVNLW